MPLTPTSPPPPAPLSPAEFEASAARLATAEPEDSLRWTWERFGAHAAIGTSFQGAGIVILHLARELDLGFPAFTLDTGLIFPETLELKRRLEERLEITIETVEPEISVAEQARLHGEALWERDPDACCTLRKVAPLRRKLFELNGWITGLRREQSDARANVAVLELHDIEGAEGRRVAKINPLALWERARVWDYLRRHHLPWNPLHDRGYRSIGCRPCTRSFGENGAERAGRWTGFGKTECGIHTFTRRRSP
ncbi:MAG: phosphoadenylyl-sulfate reductase [Verrucomicrobiae bacterium]|nr:phosphoadenylyl-sulfate reductase [Verrucomicrobiae bacterium]